MTKYIALDNIWGCIRLSEEAEMIAQSTAFKRMKNIKQLGTMSLTRKFKNAVGDRHAHSLGAAYLARIVMVSLQTKVPSITDREVLIVELAALCHDIGHGFMSHAFDSLMKKKGIKTPHEIRSRMIFGYIIEQFRKQNKKARAETPNRTEAKRKPTIDLSDDEVMLIQHFIHPLESDRVRIKFTKGIDQIINNYVCEIDVDKMDYILRDSTYLGASNDVQVEAYDIIGILERSNIIDGIWCFDRNDQADLIRLISKRYMLYSDYYLHPDSVALEEQMLGMLQIADQTLNFLECAELKRKVDFKSFFMLTDAYILEKIFDCDVNSPLQKIKVFLTYLQTNSIEYERSKVKKYCNTLLSNNKSNPDVAIQHIRYYDRNEASSEVNREVTDVNREVTESKTPDNTSCASSITTTDEFDDRLIYE